MRLIKAMGPIRLMGLMRLMGPMGPIGLIALLAFLALASCQREPLELYLKGDSEVRIDYIWTRYKYPYPNGLLVMFAKDGNNIGISYPTHDLAGEDKDMMENGTYRMLAMTNTFEEYQGNMNFFNTDNYEDIRASAVVYNITNMNAWDYGRQYLTEPLPLGVAIDSFDVKMNNEGLVFYEYKKKGYADTLQQKRNPVVLPMITTLTIKVKVIGINFMKNPNQGGVEGYISGMANGFYLTQLWRSTAVGDIKLSNWKILGYETRGSDEVPTGIQTGWIGTTVETFGLPHGRELLKDRTPESNYIKLHFTLLDGRTIDFDYNVGKDIRYVGDDGALEATFTQSDVALELNLEINAPFYEDDEVPTLPYAQPTGTGAFDAEVQDWGDDENVDVPM